MNWYLAKIVYRIICGNGNHTPQFDEQLRLIEADDEEQAFQKALSTGKEEEIFFVNDRQTQVQWRFINVAELYCINNFGSGAELYSRIEETENADIYIAFINQKAEKIRENIDVKMANTV